MKLAPTWCWSRSVAIRLLIVLSVVVPAVSEARPGERTGPRDLTVVFQPAPRPSVDLKAAEARTQEYQGLVARGELLARDRVYDQGLAGLVVQSLAAAGSRGAWYTRFRFPGRLASEELKRVQTAAQTVGDARAALRTSHALALQYLARIEAEGGSGLLRERTESDRKVLQKRFRRADDLLDRLQYGLTLKAGGRWSRFRLWCRQVVGRDPAATAEDLNRALTAWGASRGDVLGAELTYVRGSVSAVEFPQYSTIPAHAAATGGALSLEDASEGSEIELSAELRAKAEELGTALEAWRFVQDQGRLDWYYGSLKGSAETFRSMRGNDTDLAGLLIALLRAQGTPARYVRGTIEVPVARLAGAMGLLEEPEAQGPVSAARVAALRDLEVATLTAAGIPFEPVTSGGELAAFRLLHTWVEAYLPYGDYRGVGRGQSPKRWVPLDPSFAGSAKYAASGPQVDPFAGTSLTVDGLVTEYLSGTTSASPLELAQTRVEERVSELAPGTGYAGALRTVMPRPEALPFLPGALPYAPRVVHDEFAFLPEEAKHRVRITARDAQGVLMDVTLPAHQLVGHRTIFSYRPASPDDEQQVALAGGLYEAPASVVQVLPVLRVEGVERSAATRSVGLGSRHEWTIELLLPDGSSRRITNQIVAGNIVAVGLGAPGNSRTEETPSAGGGDQEGKAGRFLYRIAARYSTQWTEAEDELARLLQVVPVRPTANVVLVSNQLQVDELLGVPRRILWKGLEVDADHRSLTPVELVAGRGGQLLRLSGHQGSWLEAQVLSDATHEQAVCAVTILQEAQRQGVPVLEITPENYAATIGGVSAGPEILAEVEDLIARKRRVLIPIAPLTIRAWTGTGYVARDPATEEGGYFLSGRISGGQTVVSPPDWEDQDLVAMLERPDAPHSTNDLTQIARIAKSPASDLQQTVVGKPWERPLVVYVTTGEGVPVSGATVTFRSIAESHPEFVPVSGLEAPMPAPALSVVTDEYGRATVMAFPDESITTLGILQPGTPNRQLIGLNRVTAEVQRATGERLVLAAPFTLTALPESPSLVAVREPAIWGAPTKMMLGAELPATVTDRFHNPIANQTVTWTQVPATGAFIEPRNREADRIVLLNTADPRQQVTLAQTTDTTGQVVVNYINGGAHHTLHAVAGDAVGTYTVSAVGADTVEYVLGYVPSGRASFDGVMGTYFPEPFVFQLLRRSRDEGGAPWLPILGNEPEYRSATLAMTTWSGASQLGDEIRMSPRDSLGMSPLDSATNAVFWPRYLAEDATQELRFNADVILADGTRDCCESQFAFDMFSSVPKVDFARVLPGGTVSDFGTTFVRTSDDAVEVSVANKASYPIYARLLPNPAVASDSLCTLPGVEDMPHHPTDPELIEVEPASTVRVQIPLNHGSRGGAIRVQVMAPDVDAAGAPALTQVAQAQVDVVLAPRILSRSDDLASRDEMQKGLDEQRRYLHLDYEYPGNPSRTDLLVRNASEEIVYQEAYEGLPQSRTIRWDGMLPSGQVVPTGNYTAQVVVTQDGDVVGATDRWPFAVIRTNLDVDTDRDGVIDDEKDEAGKSEWTKDRGAIYAVNLDADEGQTDILTGLPLPDAVNVNDEGIPDYDDQKLRSDSDVEDLTPMILHGLGARLPDGVSVYLKAGNLDEVQAIHVFAQMKAPCDAILGGVGSRNPADPSMPLEVEITQLLDPSDPKYVGQGTNGDVTLGIEGLFFRYLDPSSPLNFQGEINLAVEYRMGSSVLFSDTVRLKVAPWIMVPQSQPSMEVWVNEGGLAELADGGGLHEEDTWSDAGTQWFQDHAETGYTERPHGPKTLMTLRMPYYREPITPESPPDPQPRWVRKRLLRPGFGVYQLGLLLGRDSDGSGSTAGNYGGNLELLPPTAERPLGRIVVGSTRSERLVRFLESQQVQADPILEVPTDWLDVGHADEAFAFTSTGSVVIRADPNLVYSLLENGGPGLGEGAVLFAMGALAPITGSIESVSENRVNVRFARSPEGSKWDYLRIYDGGGAGQVVKVEEVGADYVTFHTVYWTGSKVIPPTPDGRPSVFELMHREPDVLPRVGGCGPQACPIWHVAPQLGDKVVLVQGARAWERGMPAVITVQEVLADGDLRRLNTDTLWGEIEQGWNTLYEGSGHQVRPVSVPVLFVGERFRDRTAVAFNPDLANGQTVNGVYFMPVQYGPRTDVSVDVLEEGARRALSQAGVAVGRFVEDWDSYHKVKGEVHCGSTVVRAPFNVEWWTKQP